MFKQSQYYKNSVQILKKLGFIGGNIDPCLYVMNNKKDIVYVALYVDDNLMIVDIEAIEEAITANKKMG